jgi:hypothetical protein
MNITVIGPFFYYLCYWSVFLSLLSRGAVPACVYYSLIIAYYLLEFSLYITRTFFLELLLL